MDQEEIIDLARIERENYSEAVQDAVRYGYHYRLEAEKHAEHGCKMHCCIGDPSAVLLWLANLVISGAVFNLIHKTARRLWDKMMQMKVEIPEDVNKVLLDEDELRRFVKYVDEFDKKELSTTDKERNYIREEIIADYMGKEADAIQELYHRMPTQDEYRIIIRGAYEHADKLLKGKDNVEDC